MKLGSVATLTLLCLSPVLVAGCSSSFDSADSPPVSLSVGTISGAAYGGRQPISGARIYLYQTNTTAYAGPGLAASGSNASVSLIHSGGNASFDGTNYYVTTAANGSFTITGDYNACASGSQVYLYATGGNPGAGTNTEAGLLAVLGTCGSYSSSTTVNINEVSTIAAAYAMAGFATDPTHIGAPSASNTVAATGVANAFANAAQLYDTTTNPFTSPNTNARTTTPGNGTNGGTGVPDYQKVNTLANILSSCINSVGGTASTQCTTLFADMKSASGTAATDTAGIAIDMAQNSSALVSGTSDVTAVYNTTGVGGTNPYTPWYNTAAPNDFAIQVTYTGAGLVAGYTTPEGLAIDASGNVWVSAGQGAVASSAGTTLSGFNHLGVPLKAGGYTGIGLSTPLGIAVDNTSSYVYIANFDNNNLIKFNISSGTAANTFALASGAGPAAVALDSDNVPWVADGLLNQVEQRNPGTGALGTTLTGNGMNGIQTLAIKQGTHGDIWVASAGSFGVSAFTWAGAGNGNNNNASVHEWTGLAFDANNNAFDALYNLNGVEKVLGSSLSSASWFNLVGGFESELAIDGSNRVWLADSDFGLTADATKNGIFLIDSTTGAISNGSRGYRALPNTEPDSIAVDASGNIWFNSVSDGSLHEMIGAATPVALPIGYATANSKLGSRP